jgi:hypothetical protein
MMNPMDDMYLRQLMAEMGEGRRFLLGFCLAIGGLCFLALLCILIFG